MTQFSDYSFPSFTGGRSRTLNQRLDQFGAVNAAEMPNFAGNGSTDDLIPLQAAVAKALADGKGSVIIPAGASCAISATLGLWYEAAQTNPAFSLALVSAGPHGNHEGQGGIIKPTFNGVGVMVGPGQEMLVENIAVVDTNAAYGPLQDTARIGIGISGGSGGASGWTLRDCHVYGMSTGVKAGLVNGSLCDSGLLEKVNIASCGVGVDYASTQNYIQSLVGCTISARTAVIAALGHNVNIFGGNPSNSSGRAGVFTLASVSAITADGFGNYTFTATVTNPDANLVGGLYIDGALDLPHFGLVPVVITNYNSGTQVVSLSVLIGWSTLSLGVNLKTGSDFETVVQANTTVVFAERLTTLHGDGFNVKGIHLENPSGYTRLLESASGFDSGSHITHIDGLYCNWDPGQPQDSDATLQTAKRKVQKVHPFVNLTSGGLVLENARFSQGSVALSFDMTNGQILEVKNWRSLAPPNVRGFLTQHPFTGNGYEFYGEAATGVGIWTPTPFASKRLSTTDIAQRQQGWNKSEFWGFFPAKDRTPRLTPSQVTILSGTLPTFTNASDTGYPLLCGGTLYSIGSEVESNSGAAKFLRSDHKGYSYGQNLTTTNVTNLAWSFYGATNKLVVNVEAFNRLFPGLVLNLSHASINSGVAFEVIVRDMFYEELYVNVVAFSGSVLPGTAATQYTGTTIGQAAYSITTI